MNKLTLSGLALAGVIIAVDHLAGPLPEAVAVVSYTIAVILFVAGIYRSRKKNS